MIRGHIVEETVWGMWSGTISRHGYIDYDHMEDG